jgi:hypothetical protein
MTDCPNVEMRDRLPDLANDMLEPAMREVVLIHLAGCAPCTAEIEILRTMRLMLVTATPRVNVAGIVSALPQYGVTSIAAAPSARRWTSSWRLAAALTFVAAGIGSYAVLRDGSPAQAIDTAAMIAAVRDTSAGLALTGALADMSDADLSALAADIETIDALPSAEVQSTGNGLNVPTILPESIVRELEGQ